MVIIQQVPKTHIIENALPRVDFSDTFATTNHQDELPKIAHLIFGEAPGWIRFLFKIRNSFVKWFGLKTTMPDDYHENLEVGGYIGFFKIYEIRKEEILLGANDKHLNSRVSIYNSNEEKYNIKVTTLVAFNNAFGKVYMFIVRPFHYFVVKRMVRNAFKKG